MAEKKPKLTVEEKITKKELEEKLEKMIEDRDKKCKAAKDQLVEMLKITADKYLTATGTAEALRTLRFTCGSDNVSIDEANDLAFEMATETNKMYNKAKKLDPAEMDKLCDGFYDKDFNVNGHTYGDLAFEMMRIDLCRNVGGSAEDMVSFINRVEEEIEATKKALEELEG